jgi:hypothetical protein
LPVAALTKNKKSYGKSAMGRKQDLETKIRQSQALIQKYEDIVQTSSDPKEKARARREIDEQWGFIKGYLAEYVPLCERLSLAMPEDIAEIAVIVGIPLPAAPSAQPPPGPTTAPSATPTGVFPNAHALLIGISAYCHLRPLAKTTIDARDLHDLLGQSGYPAANLALLLDEQATKPAISDKLDWLAHHAGTDDTVIVFFSGHGAQRVGGFEPGEYLCPVEADWYNLRSTAISDEELTTALGAIPARRVVVFLDACHSGGVGEPKDASLVVKAGLSEAAYERLAAGEGRVVIASCKPDEVSWELPEMRNSLFTHYLLKGLRGAAADDDGAVRVFNLFDYVSKQVPQHKPQHPLFKGEIDLNFGIVLAGGQIKPSSVSIS